MAKNHYYTSRGYGNRGKKKTVNYRVLLVVVQVMLTFAGLVYMKDMTDLQLPAKLIIGVMAAISLLYMVWMIEGWRKEGGQG